MEIISKVCDICNKPLSDFEMQNMVLSCGNEPEANNVNIAFILDKEDICSKCASLFYDTKEVKNKKLKDAFDPECYSQKEKNNIIKEIKKYRHNLDY